jgi:hypothetical protein
VIGLGLRPCLGLLPISLSLLRSILRPPVDGRSHAAAYNPRPYRGCQRCARHARNAQRQYPTQRGILSAAEWTARPLRSSRSKLDLQYIVEVVFDHQLGVINFGPPA